MNLVVKMSSYLQEQKRLIEEKKRQVMERASMKKDCEKNSNMSTQVTTNATSNGPTPNILVNDGNFLARFKAMQEEAKFKKESTVKDKNPGKLKINLGGAKKKTVMPTASTLPKPSAFETQEEPAEGKSGM